MSDTSVNNTSLVVAGDLVLATRSEAVVKKGVARLVREDTAEISKGVKKTGFTQVPGVPKLALPSIPESKVQDPSSADSDTALDDLTKAFCAVFTSMSNGMQGQMDQFQETQTLDNTMSTIVVDSANVAIAAQMTVDTLQTAVNDAEAAEAKMQSQLGWMQWLGLGLTVVAILMSIPTAGASDAALVADDLGVETTDMSAGSAGSAAGGISSLSDLEAAADAAETEATQATSSTEQAAEDLAPNANKAGNSAADNGANAAKAGSGKSGAQESETDVLARERAHYQKAGKWFRDPYDYQKYTFRNYPLERASDNLQWMWNGANDTRAASEAWRSKMVMKLFSFIGTACATTPGLLDGIAKLGISEAQTKLAQAQKAAAPYTAMVQENQMNFQFLQQLSQRQTGLIQTSGEQLSDVILLAGSVMKGYQQVQTNLVHPA